MGSIRINLHATFRLAAKTKVVEVEWTPGMTLGEALRELTAQYPMLREALFAADGGWNQQVHVFVNRQDATHAPGGPGREMKAGDILDLFPPISGGEG